MDVALQQFLLILFQGIALGLVPVVLGSLSAAGIYATKLIKSKLSQRDWERLKSVVREVVVANEQAKLSGAISKEAAYVKQKALTDIQRELNRIGLKTFAENLPLISTSIEAAVYTEFNSEWVRMKEELTALG